MKQGIYATIWLISFLLLNSCIRQHNHNILLVQADSLMEEYPDSALHILESIESQQLTVQADRAYYALLLTQARDKNYIVQTDDSLIRTAVQYYDSIGDVRMQAKAYYYKGCIYRDANLCGEAVQEYLTAISLAKKAGNPKLQGLICNHAGYLYYLQDLLEQADSIYQLTEQLAIQQNDTSLWADALSFQGKINIKQGIPYYPRAEEKLLKAFDMTNTPNYKQLQADIAAALSSLYNSMELNKKAVHYAKLNISLRNDTAQHYRAFLLLGDAYFKAGLYDSATLYINKSLSSTGYGTQASAYMRLAEIAKVQGDLDKSLEFTKKHTLYLDSLHLAKQSNDILIAEKEVAKQQYTNNLGYQNKKLHILIIVSALLICIIGIIYAVLRRSQQKAHHIEQEQSLLEKEKQDLQQKYIQLKNELTQKEAEIVSQQKDINQHHINEEKKKELQQELDTLARKRSALAKETLEHSEVYSKIERIINSYKKYDKSEEQLNDNDWQRFIVETDIRWDKAITRLRIQCELEKEEVHLCCLLLTDFPVAHLEYIIKQTRNTIYRKEKEILKKAGCPSGTNKLKGFLKNY
jgi:hypothetical protein